MNSEEYLKKAYDSILQNDFEQAIHWFEEALSVYPDRGDIHYRYSITCARSNRLDKAMQHAQQAIVLAPDQKTYMIHYERLQAKEMTLTAKRELDASAGNRPDKGDDIVELLQKAIELDPLSIEAKFWLAIAYGEMKQYELALHALRDAKALLLDDSAAKGLNELEQRYITYMDQSNQSFS